MKDSEGDGDGTSAHLGSRHRALAYQATSPFANALDGYGQDGKQEGREPGQS